MTTNTIQIDGMKGDTCVKDVTRALRNIDGVEVKSVAVGSAVIDCKDDAACDVACGAITDSGYKAHRSNRPPTGPGKSGGEPEQGTPSRDSGNAARDSGSKQSGTGAGDGRHVGTSTSHSTGGSSTDAPASGAQRPDPTRGGSPTGTQRGTDQPPTGGKPAGR